MSGLHGQLPAVSIYYLVPPKMYQSDPNLANIETPVFYTQQRLQPHHVRVAQLITDYMMSLIIFILFKY